MIFIDMVIFLIEKLFKNDEKYIITSEFLNSDLKEKCTSVFNLFEFIGIAYFNLSTTDLKKLLKGFSKGYTIRYCVFEKIILKMSFSDALILSVAEEHSCSKFVTWHVKHFEGRTDIRVNTPEEMLTL